MEFLEEVNAFYKDIKTKDLTWTATSLWFALLHTNSQVDWAKEFKVSGATLLSKACLPATSFKRARKSLVDNGLIEHRTKGNKATIEGNK